MTNVLKFISIFIFMVMSIWTAYADITIDTRQLIDSGRVIEISPDSTNMLKFPLEIKDIRTSKRLNVLIDGKTLLVSMVKPELTEVYVVMSNGKIYSLILKPKHGAIAYNYLFVDHEIEIEKAHEAESGIPFETIVRNMIMSAKKTGQVDGYQAKLYSHLIFKHKDHMSQKLSEFIGDDLILEEWAITNTTNKVLALKEQDFYQQGVAGIMLDMHNLKPKETTNLYIVSKK